MHKRPDGRNLDELRPIKITRGFMSHAEGSALIEMGETRVICSASVENRVPRFLVGKRSGWMTAEYAMLPRSTHTRSQRERQSLGGRTQEIQRVIGRALRAVVDLKKLGERTLWIDCDVIHADGGTRTASISGAYVAVADAVSNLLEKRKLKESPIREAVAAVSVGVVRGQPALDLCYSEDSSAEVDMNIVMTGGGKFVELQGTAEGAPFDRDGMDGMIALAEKGIQRIIEVQAEALSKPLP